MTPFDRHKANTHRVCTSLSLTLQKAAQITMATPSACVRVGARPTTFLLLGA